MTEKNKTDVIGRGFRVFGLMSGSKLFKTWQTVLLGAILVAELNARAQANLINLYDWSNDTRYSSSPNYNVRINSSDSAAFFGGQGTNNAPYSFALPILTGVVDTTPGALYEISFMMQNDFVENGKAEICFDGFTTNLNLPAVQENPVQVEYYPIDVNFTWQATSLTSDFKFTLSIDDGDAVSLNNLLITEVPESSSGAIFGVLGCAWFLMRWCRTKRSLVPAKASRSFKRC